MPGRRRHWHGPKARGTTGSADGAEDVAGTSAPTGARPRGSARNVMGLKPTDDEVLQAVESLYVDQLKPFGRILRKRIAELASIESTAKSIGSISVGASASSARDVTDGIATCRTIENSQHSPDVDVNHLRAVCDSSKWLDVQPEEGGDWSAVFVGRPPSFVDVYDAHDPYPQDLWVEAAEYFQGLTGEDMRLPGGRYSCAQMLVSRKLPFLAGLSLGEVCHMVQLALSQKKILGYSNGAVLPYSQSQSMIKERCASSQQPWANEGEVGSLPRVTWEEARACLKAILDADSNSDDTTAPSTVPLSNVKRLFRSQYQRELSETALGHSKLSELLQDARFSDICTVELQGHGYIVVQTMAGLPSTSRSRTVNAATQHEGLDNHNAASPVFAGELRGLELSNISPVRFDEEDFPLEGVPENDFFSMPLPSPDVRLASNRWPASTELPQRNTFIHAAQPPPTPPPGARRRSNSLPNDVCSERNLCETSWQTLFSKHGNSQESTTASFVSPRGVQGPLTGASDPRSSDVATDFLQLLVPGSPAELQRERSSDGAASSPIGRLRFCPGQPLRLEDAGDPAGGEPSGVSTLAEPSATAVWPPPVRKTFIDLPLTPVTPAPGAVRRVQSQPQLQEYGSWMDSPFLSPLRKEKGAGAEYFRSAAEGSPLREPMGDTRCSPGRADVFVASPQENFELASPALTGSPSPTTYERIDAGNDCTSRGDHIARTGPVPVRLDDLLFGPGGR